MRLLDQDGWTNGGRRTHGVLYYRRFPGELRPRSTIIPDKSSPLPQSTLGLILGVKQTGLGRTGLQDLIDKYR